MDTQENKPTHRRRDALRDNGLATMAMILVVAVAVAGWSASFISLHEFATAHMGLNSRPAWLVPSTFDGAALGLSLLAFRAAIYGRASLGSLIFVYGFTGLSSWINWVHIDDPRGRFVASLLPIAAVLVFGKVLREAREAFERRNGKVVFKVRGGLLLLRWFVDRPGTRAAIRNQILGIPVQALIGLGADALARKAAEELAANGTVPPATATGNGKPKKAAPERPATAATPTATGTALETGGNGNQAPASGNRETTATATSRPAPGNREATVLPISGTGRRSAEDWAVLALPLWHQYVAKHGETPTAPVIAALLRNAYPNLPIPGSERSERNIRVAIEQLLEADDSEDERAEAVNS